MLITHPQWCCEVTYQTMMLLCTWWPFACATYSWKKTSFKVYLAMTHKSNSWDHGVGYNKLQYLLTFVVCKSMPIQNIVQSVLLPFLQREGNRTGRSIMPTYMLHRLLNILCKMLANCPCQFIHQTFLPWDTRWQMLVHLQFILYYINKRYEIMFVLGVMIKYIHDWGKTINYIQQKGLWSGFEECENTS